MRHGQRGRRFSSEAHDKLYVQAARSRSQRLEANEMSCTVFQRAGSGKKKNNNIIDTHVAVGHRPKRKLQAKQKAPKQMVVWLSCERHNKRRHIPQLTSQST